MAQVEVLALTMEVVGGDEGPARPLVGLAVQDEPTVPQEPQVGEMRRLPGAPPTCVFLSGGHLPELAPR